MDGRSALLLARPGRIRGIDLARLVLERVLLAEAEPDLRVFLIGLDKDQVEAVRLASFDRVVQWINDLLVWRARGLSRPLPAFRKSAEAFAAAFQRSADEGQARRAALAAWSEGDFPESADLHHQLFARHREDSILGEVFEAFAHVAFVPLYGAVEEIGP
jgi:exonuclease V gamma subunit